jgi:predicted transcriptional regulator
MKTDTNKTHVYLVKNWDPLSSGKPVTLHIDEGNDGIIDKSIDLQSNLKGEEVEALILKEPVGGPFLPIELIIVVGFVCIVGVGALLTEIGKWALLSLFLPLYSKIKKGDLLNHPVRHRIQGYIIGNPGAHFALIKQDLNLGNGQLIYHLKRLSEANLIYSKEDGIKKRFYPVDFPRSKTTIYILNEIQKKIFGVIEKRPGISQKKIANSTGISRQVAGYHLSKLEQEGMIKKEVVGRHARYYASEKTGA